MDVREIVREIEALENGRATYSTVEKLALLYIVRDHLAPEERTVKEYSHANKSEFVQAASGLSMESLLSVLDEHMEAIRAIYPKEYNAVCKKLKEKARA